MKDVFDPVINQIVDLVSKQVDEAKNTRNAKINVGAHLCASETIFLLIDMWMYRELFLLEGLGIRHI